MTTLRGDSTGETNNFCEKRKFFLKTNFSNQFLGKGSAAEATEVGERVEKYKAKTTQID